MCTDENNKKSLNPAAPFCEQDSHVTRFFAATGL